MTKYPTGSIVVIEHPVMYDTHVLAQIVSTTAKTATIRYYAQDGTLREDLKRRNLDAITGILAAEYAPADAFACLKDSRLMLVEEQRKAKQGYTARLGQLVGRKTG